MDVLCESPMNVGNLNEYRLNPVSKITSLERLIDSYRENESYNWFQEGNHISGVADIDFIDFKVKSYKGIARSSNLGSVFFLDDVLNIHPKKEDSLELLDAVKPKSA